MFWADNRAWGARTRFSDDLFVLEEAPPQICDDLKQRRFAMLDVRPGKGRSDPNHYRDQPMIHHPSRSSVVSKAKGPAQRDRRCMAASICSCGQCHRECGPSPSMLSRCTASYRGAEGAVLAPLPLSGGCGERGSEKRRV